MEIRKNIPIKDVTNLMRRKTKRPIIVQEVDSDNDIQPRDAELEFENINLNFEKYCYLCHKEINFFSENHPFFQCMTCLKYFHRECYKEYKLKQTEKELCKSVIIINKIQYEPNPQSNTQNNLDNNSQEKIQNKNVIQKKNKFFGKECILCIMQNNNYCTICKKNIDIDNELIILCELCGNLMHYKCLDVPLYFIFYRELYKNIFINNNIKNQKYKEFILRIKEIKNSQITKELLPKIYEEIKIKPFPNILNYLFYVCSFCKTRNLYDLQEINVYKSTSFSKVNFYNTTLNPISQNINKVKSSWNLNKIHEIYISSSNPYNDALFDTEKYDSSYIIPKPVKIIKKYEHNRINNIIIKNSSLNNGNNLTENEVKKEDNKNNNNKQNITEEEEIFELSNIVQMFEDGEQKNKENDNGQKDNKNDNNNPNDNNKNINGKNNENIPQPTNNNYECSSKTDKAQSDKMDVISENIDLNEFEKSESGNDNISIKDKCFYLIKWNTLEYSLELDSFMDTFVNFPQVLSDFNKEEIKIEKGDNYPTEKIFEKKLNQILIELDITKKDNELKNLVNNSFIYKTKEQLNKYKKDIVSIITKLYNQKEEKNDYTSHILILNDNFKNNNDLNNSLFKLIEKNDINILNLSSNMQTFIYECINFSEDLTSFPGDDLNILRINNNIYLHKNKENILEEEKIKRYVRHNILVDNIDSKNLSFIQEYHFDLIIFDLRNIKSLLKLKEFFKKINSPMNTNYKTLKYILLEQSESSSKKNNNNVTNNESLNNDFKDLEIIINNFFNLFYNKEDTILLYGNYSGINIKVEEKKISGDVKDNLRQINLISDKTKNIPEDENDMDAFYYKKNFINLNYSTLQYNDLFNGLLINNMKWAFYLDQTKYHYTQILSSLITKFDSKVFSLRSKDYNEIIMNFIPIYLDKETFIQYLYIIKNKPEELLKTQENKKDLMQNILLLCSLPSCMTKFYKKYLEDYKLPIKDNINISKIDVFYQLSRILLTKTKGKVIIIFPLHDKVYRENDSLLRKIRKEIEKIFFSNINPDNKEINLEERKKNFFCFLMDEDGLFEEIRNSENAKYPTNIIIFNMFLQNKNTGEFFSLLTKNKYRHKIILYQLYISNLIEGKLSQIFYSKLNQFIEICASPLRKMKTTVYGQLTLIDKEIITITDLKKTFENEMSNLSDELEMDNRNDLSKINIVTSYKNLKNEEKKFDGFIYVQKNSYLICTNSNNINLRFDNIYNTFVGNVSFNNCDNNLLNNGKNDNDDDNKQKTHSWLETYNDNLIKYKKKKFYQELDFLKDESNFENLKTNKYDLTTTSPGTNNTNNNGNNNNSSINNSNANGNNNFNINYTYVQNGGNNNIQNINNHNINNNNTRGEEILILNDSNENYGPNRTGDMHNGQKKKRGRKRKNDINSNSNNTDNNNTSSNNINNNVNNNGEPIQIPNDEENEDMNNSILSDDIRSNNNINNPNIINNAIMNNLNNINTNSNNNTNNENQVNNNQNNIPVNLDEITEDYSDTFSENSQERANLQNNNEENNIKKEKNEIQPMEIEGNNNNKEISPKDDNNDQINKNKDLNFQESTNEEKTYDIIKSIASSILSKKQNQNEYQEPIPNPQNIKNSISEMNRQDIEQIEKLINDTKLESSRDRLFKVYNYLLTKGFEERTRKLFVKCLLNYGFPLVNEFNKFYILFQMNAQHLKIKNIPNKIDTQLYYELVYFILEEDESLDYNLFVFGEERTSLIRVKLLIMRQFQSFKDVTKAMYHFVKDRNSVLFGNIEPKLDESYQRVHFVMAKILSNIVSKCIKSGFLNYKNYIKDDNIIFDNIRIKKDGQPSSAFNIREGIAKKIFGKTMNENEFNNAIITYYEALFVQVIKVPDSILNNNENVIR